MHVIIPIIISHISKKYKQVIKCIFYQEQGTHMRQQVKFLMIKYLWGWPQPCLQKSLLHILVCNIKRCSVAHVPYQFQFMLLVSSKMRSIFSMEVRMFPGILSHASNWTRFPYQTTSQGKLILISSTFTWRITRIFWKSKGSRGIEHVSCVNPKACVCPLAQYLYWCWLLYIHYIPLTSIRVNGIMFQKIIHLHHGKRRDSWKNCHENLSIHGFVGEESPYPCHWQMGNPRCLSQRFDLHCVSSLLGLWWDSLDLQPPVFTNEKLRGPVSPGFEVWNSDDFLRKIPKKMGVCFSRAFKVKQLSMRFWRVWFLITCSVQLFCLVFVLKSKLPHFFITREVFFPSPVFQTFFKRVSKTPNLTCWNYKPPFLREVGLSCQNFMVQTVEIAKKQRFYM